MNRPRLPAAVEADAETGDEGDADARTGADAEAGAEARADAATGGDALRDRVERSLREAALVVFDLDGTLVRLAVDWEAFRDHLAGFVPPDDLCAGPERPATWTLARLRERGDEATHDRVLDVLRTRELQGAVASSPVQAGMDLLRRALALGPEGRPLALLTNNTRAAAQEALRRHGVRPAFRMVVALEDVDRPKPHADGLELVLDRFEVPPADVLFIGDGRKDATAAERAGVAFLDVEEWEVP